MDSRTNNRRSQQSELSVHLFSMAGQRRPHDQLGFHYLTSAIVNGQSDGVENKGGGLEGIGLFVSCRNITFGRHTRLMRGLL